MSDAAYRKEADSRDRRARPNAGGFTLAELVLSLAITTIIGLAITGVAAAVSRLNERAEAYYEFLHSGRIASSRLEETLRPALLVTAASGSSMVIWMEDSYDVGSINPSELAHVYLDSGAGELLMKTTEFPDSLKTKTRNALDDDLALSNLTSINSLNFGSGHASYDVTKVMARNVRSFEVFPDVPAPMTRMLKFKLVIGDGDQAVTEYGAVTLRASCTASVSLVDGKYSLN